MRDGDIKRPRDSSSSEADDRIGALIRLAGPRPDVPQERASRVAHAVRTHWRVAFERQRQRRWTWRVAGIVAAASTVAVLGFAIWGPPTGPAPLTGRLEVKSGEVLARAHGEVDTVAARTLEAGETVREGESIETGLSAGAGLVLATGHSLRIDGSSRVRLEGSDRVVLTSGRIYLDSRPDSAQSRGGLVVETPHAVIAELGTRYFVTVSEGATRVAVRDGTVEARSARGGTTTLGVGRLARFDEEGLVESEAQPTHGAEWEWAVALGVPLEIDGRSLREFLEWVAREGGYEIAYERESNLGLETDVVLSGSIAGMSLEEALSAVLPTCGLSHRLERGRLTIVPLR